MAEPRVKSLAKPDEVMNFPLLTARVVDLGDITVGHFVYEPGWSWKEHMRPSVGGEWCQARHLGMVISGRLGVEFPDGTKMEVGPGEVCDIPPGHNGWVIGDEPAVQIEWVSKHYEAARVELERYRGDEVDTTGDGLLARFAAPAPALHCAGEGDEILVSETTRFVAGSDLGFEDRGVHTLKGLDGEWRLFRFVTGPS